MATITAIDDITDAKAKKLRAAGIRTTDMLLAQANTKKRRQKLAEETKLTEKQILSWVNRADLMRIKGISTQTSGLLEAAGVDTVKELRRRNAENLAAAMEDKNAKAKKKVARTPSVKVVQGWVDQAKKLKLTVQT